MIGLGTIVNMLAIIFIGVEGTLSGMFTVTNASIETSGTLLLIGSLVIGGLIGEAIDLGKKSKWEICYRHCLFR